MENKERFDKTVKILVNAYLNNTMVQNNCHACAVGNIMAAHLDIKYDQNLKWIDLQVAWPAVFITSRYQIAQVKRPWAYNGAAKVQIDATGYSWQELARMEYAFERAPRGKSKEDHIFNGLMAVVDVLCLIHGMDEKARDETKGLFMKV